MWQGNTWQIISVVLYIMNMVLAIFISTALILKKQDPVKTLSWVIVLIHLPYIGILLYAFVGQNFRKKKIYSRKGIADYNLRKKTSAKQLETLKASPEQLGNELLPFKKIIFQNLKNSHTVLDNNYSIEFFFSGVSALDAMYRAIEEAKNHIHLQSYIIENDLTGNRFKDLLVKKAKEGLEVMVMYDGVGSIGLKKNFINELKNGSVEVIPFAPVRIFMPMSKLNYRNHRKILVVDGTTGFIGGVNIADRYYYGTPEGDWHDTHIKITGTSVFSLQACFMMDRHFAMNRRFRFKRKYYPELKLKEGEADIVKNNIYSQIISSGPDSDWASIMQCYFSAITSAKSHIYIVSPYFTPCESILNAIKIAALSDIDVRIMLPEKSDTKLVQYGTMSFVGELLDAGVRIYLFKNGFNHSKVISIDGNMSIVGSANMDVRSFEHNFEIMAVIYNRQCADTIEKKFIEDTRYCDLINMNKWKRRGKLEKVKESFARLLSPLL